MGVLSPYFPLFILPVERIFNAQFIIQLTTVSSGNKIPDFCQNHSQISATLHHIA